MPAKSRVKTDLPLASHREDAGMHKKPIYGGKIVLITETADITPGDFLNKVFGPLRVCCGAAQNMELFLHTHPYCKIYAPGELSSERSMEGELLQCFTAEIREVGQGG